MRCLLCGHVRTRLDPLPDTACPACGVDYAVAQQQVEAGLVRALPTEAQKVVRKRSSVRFGVGGIVVLGGALAALWMLGRDDAVPLAVEPSAHSTAPAVATPLQAQPAVLLYTAAWCKVCAHTKRYLSRNGIRYSEHDVERSAQAWREYKQYPGEGVPLIVIGDSATRGFNERWLKQRLGPWLGRPSG